MANIIKRVWNQNRMVLIEDLRGMTFQAEAAGHTFQISGIDDDGNTVALTGTPSGVLLRPDNTDVALNCSVSGGVVSATLPANCYDVPGRFSLTIFITSGGSKTAIYAAVGTVTRTSSGTVAPGTSQSVVDLINAINAAVNSIPASYSALLADIAPTYSNSALYSVGQYVWYDGDLKRCIVPITTAESYTAAHWTSAVLGQDVSDLKSAFGNATGNTIIDYTPGYYIDLSGDTVDINSPTASSTGFQYAIIDVSEGDQFTVNGTSGTKPRAWCFIYYDSENLVWKPVEGYKSGTSRVTNTMLTTPPTATKLVLNQKNTDDHSYYGKLVRNDISELDKYITYTGVVFTTSNGAKNAYFESDKTNECLFLKITGVWYLRGSKANSSGNDYASILTGEKMTSTLGVENCVKLVSGQGIVYDKSDSTWKVVSLALPSNQNPNYIVVFYAGNYTENKVLGIAGGIGQWVYIDFLTKQMNDDLSGELSGLNSDLAKYVGISARISFSTQYGVNGCYFETDGDTYLYMKISGNWYLRGYTNPNTAYDDVVPNNRYTSPSGVTDCIRLASNDAIVYDLSDTTWKIVTLNARANVDFNQVPVFIAGYFEDTKKFGVVNGIGQYLYQAFFTEKSVEDSAKRYFYGTLPYAEQAETLIRKVLADRDSDTVTAAVITDCHHSNTNDLTEQVDIFNRIAEKCADFSVNLGDSIQGLSSTLESNMGMFTKFWEHQKDSKIPVMFCRGNHEMAGALVPGPNYVYMGDYPTYSTSGNYSYVGDDSSAIPLKNVLGIPFRQNEYDVAYSNSKGNWFFDFNGIRFIGLDGSRRYNGGFDEECRTFLISALNTDKKIVVFCHFPANQEANWDLRIIQNSSDVETALNGNNNVLAYIHGHTHFDNIMTITGNGFPYIATCCALPTKGDETKRHAESAVYWDRTKGTYTEYCFDIYNIHKDSGKIKIFRFGVGNDREYPVQE